MSQIIDIDTAETPPTLVISDDKQLCDIVYGIAQKQLIIDAAKAEAQAKLEAAKKAFTDATEPLTTEIKTQFAAVEAYAHKHRDRLFPLKGKTRKKTYAVLEHKLQYRKSSQVEAPANAVEIIHQLIRASEINIFKIGPGQHAQLIQAMIGKLERLIRHPAPELNKEAIPQAIEDADLKFLLEDNGIRMVDLETFKLVFKFSPNSKEDDA
jgi:phage host-nuclease inhibitor protein Gam